MVIDQGPLAGAEIDVNVAIGWGVRRDVIRLLARDPDETQADQVVRVDRLWDLFATEGLLGWNVQENGKSLPATVEGLNRIEPDLVIEMIGTWAGSIGKAPPPLASRPTRRPSTASSSTGASSRRRSTAKTPTSSSARSR